MSDSMYSLIASLAIAIASSRDNDALSNEK